MRKGHKKALEAWSDEQFAAYPLDEKMPGYYGRGCVIEFTDGHKTKRHKGLVVLSGPMRDSLRRERQGRLETLDKELSQLRTLLGEPRMCTLNSHFARLALAA